MCLKRGLGYLVGVTDTLFSDACILERSIGLPDAVDVLLEDDSWIGLKLLPVGVAGFDPRRALMGEPPNPGAGGFG